MADSPVDVFDHHDDEEKQVSEVPTSIQSEPDHPTSNNSYTNNNRNAAPAAAFTFIPPQYQQPLPEYSSQPVIPSPKTHYHSPKKPIHSKQSNSMHNNVNKSPSPIHTQSKSHSNVPTHTYSHPMVKTLVDMGFPQTYVERACKIFKKNFGNKPYRLEVLTEIILRLQRKDGLGHHSNGNNNSDNKSLEILLSKHKDKIALEASTTQLIDDAQHRNRHNSKEIPQRRGHRKQNSNSYIVNNNKNSLILIECVITASVTNTVKENYCEVTLSLKQSLADLKNLISANININSDKNKGFVYVFYHESGHIFNDSHYTIKQCMNDMSSVGYIFDDNRLTLRMGVLRQNNQKKVKVRTPPSPKPKRSSKHIKPLPPSNNIGRDRSKSTKLDIIKAKIDIETHKNFREIMTYIKDSPFWWKKMKEGVNRVKKLTSRLKSISALIDELCQLTKKFSTHCSKISMDVVKSWEDIENEFCGDVLSLNAQFFNLGDTINTLSAAASMLSLTLEKVIVDEFNAFCEKHLSKLLNSQKRLIAMKNEYEMSLQSILHNKAEKGENSDSLKRQRCENLRKNYELARYDHCIILNDIINRNRYDIILNLCAAFCAFETFFHIGYESSLSHKQFHHSIRVGLSEKDRKQKEYFDEIVSKNRLILVTVLSEGADFNEYKKRVRFKENLLHPLPNSEYKNDESKSDDDDDSFIDKQDLIRFKHVSLDYYDGYLWKQSSKSKKKWQKRWFVLTNGELEYFRNPAQSSGGSKLKNGRMGSKNKNKSNKAKDKNKEYIGNTALCKVKKAVDHDYKYVFEIITPSQRVYALQAQTSSEYNEWFYVLSNQCARLLLRKNTIDRFRRNKEMEMKSYSISDQNNFVKTQKHKLKQAIFASNKCCADCDVNAPEWVSINIGVVVCVKCCGVHRGLGTHISKMRSLKLDDLSIVNLKLIQNLGGNERLNGELLESCGNNYGNAPEFYHKIESETCTHKERSDFIKNKYTFKMFLNPMEIMMGNNKKKSFDQQLWNAVCNNDFFKVVYCLYYGADINHQFRKYNNATVIHEAVQRNYTEMVQLLVHNAANVNLEDGTDAKPNQIAIKESLNNVDNTEIQSILKTAVY